MDKIFDIQYIDAAHLLIRCAIFIAAGVIVWYLCMFAFAKLLFKKGTPFHKDHKLLLTSLWACATMILLICVYFYFLIRRIGFENIDWLKGGTYLGLLPVLLLYLLVIVVFSIRYTRYKKQLPITKII